MGRIISCLIVWIMLMVFGMSLFLWPWMLVAEAGFPLVGCIVAALYDLCWLAFFVKQFLEG